MRLLESIGIHSNKNELELLIGTKSLDPINFVFFHDLVIKGNNIVDQTKKLKEKENEDNHLERDLVKALRFSTCMGMDSFLVKNWRVHCAYWDYGMVGRIVGA
ncbi:hypothetical protein ACH5RR_026451 [Cinchona calisaya]|uniref:Uncharacterized protein n=1 Tax=Cinchona calisaya TaxID=153742 RepID=A0ABD2Z2L0_9GENT